MPAFLANSGLQRGVGQRVGFIGSPLAAQCSSLVYTSSESVWHNGLWLTASPPTRVNIRTLLSMKNELLRQPYHSWSWATTWAFGPRAYLFARVQPSPHIAHQKDSSPAVGIARSGSVIDLMIIAYILNPKDPIPLLDAAFLSEHYTYERWRSEALLEWAESQHETYGPDELADFWCTRFLNSWIFRDAGTAQKAIYSLQNIPDKRITQKRLLNEKHELIQLYWEKVQEHFRSTESMKEGF